MPKLRFYLFLILLLGVRMLWYFATATQVVYKQGSVVTLEGVLNTEPEVIGSTIKFNLNNVTITAGSGPVVHFGDQVKIVGKISCFQKAPTCSQASIYRPEISVVSASDLNGWWVTASNIKQRFNAIFQEGLRRQQADLLTGIVLGGKGLNQAMKTKLANVGLSHVIAASGMNVSFVAGIAYFILQPLRLKKIYKVIVAIGFISFYATITGFDPPIVRALIMSVVVTVAGLLGRTSSMETGLGITAFIMLWVSPTLITSASFLLSFSAVIAQISLSDLKINVPTWVTPVIEIFLQSLFASLFTLPIILIFFAKFSLISVFINPVVLWTIDPLMVLGGIAGITGMVWLEAGKFILLPAGVLLSYFYKMVDLATQFTFLNFRFSFYENSLSLIFMGGYYLLLATMVLQLRKKFHASA